MKTEYRFICFVKKKSFRAGKLVWECMNKKGWGALGTVRWYSTWKQYCFFPHGNSIYSDDCLEDISRFIKQLKEETDGKD